MTRIINDIRKYWHYSIVAARAQLESEVANSYLNWIWWVLEPLCMMVIYAIIFGQVFGMRMENYAVFIFIGVTLYDFFSKSVKSSIKIIKRNKQIVSKVYIPKYILVMSELFVSGFKMLVCLGVIFVMMVFTGMPVTWHVLWMVPILIDLYLFTFAVCTFMSHFGVFVEDLANAVNIILKFLFYFTGIFYSIQEKFPPEYANLVLRCYPVSKLISYARDVCMYGNAINPIYLLCLTIASILLAWAGIRVIYRNENAYIKLI